VPYRCSSVAARQLVFELWTRLWVAVRRIERCDQNTIDGGLDIPALGIFKISGERDVRNEGLAIARKDGDTIPRILSTPDGAVTCSIDFGLRKLGFSRFQFLEANHVGFGRLEPIKKIAEALVDVVDVEGRDLHSKVRWSGGASLQRPVCDFSWNEAGQFN
jgi:hypothetical protein